MTITTRFTRTKFLERLNNPVLLDNSMKFDKKINAAFYDEELEEFDLEKLVGKIISSIKIVNSSSKTSHDHSYVQIYFDDDTYLAISTSSVEGGDVLKTLYFDGEKLQRKEVDICH